MKVLTEKHRVLMAFFSFLALGMIVPDVALAGIAEAAEKQEWSDIFKPLYQFVYAAATGYLGRAISIVAGIMGLFLGAAKGSPVIAGVGVVLALFGVFGPVLVNAIFTSAII